MPNRIKPVNIKKGKLIDPGSSNLTAEEIAMGLHGIPKEDSTNKVVNEPEKNAINESNLEWVSDTSNKDDDSNSDINTSNIPEISNEEKSIEEKALDEINSDLSGVEFTDNPNVDVPITNEEQEKPIMSEISFMESESENIEVEDTVEQVGDVELDVQPQISLRDYGDLEIDTEVKTKFNILMSSLSPVESKALKEIWLEVISDSKTLEYIKTAIEKDKKELVESLGRDLTELEYKDIIEKYGDISEFLNEEPIPETDEIVSFRKEILNESGQFDSEAISNENVHTELIKKKVTTDRLADNSPVAFFEGIFGIGIPVIVRFPYSCFSVTLRYPNNSEVIAFNEHIENIGEDIGGALIGVNKDSIQSILIIEKLFELAKSLVVSSTLNVSDPLSYLHSPDLDLLILAITTSLNPKGIPVTIPCINGAVFKDDVRGVPKCTNTIKGVVDPIKMVYLNTSKVKDKTLLTKTTANSIELSELPDNDSVSITFECAGEVIEVIGDVPTIPVFIEKGLQSIVYLKESIIDSIGTKTLTPESFKLNPLSKLTPYIIEVKHNERTFSGDTIIGILEVFNKTAEGSEALNMFFSKIQSLNITDIGIPRYQCGCGEVNGALNGLIPINPLAHFTMTSKMRT